MVSQIEKRRHHRHVTQKPVSVFHVLPSKSGNIYEVQNSPIGAQTVDLSEGGAGLQISTRTLQPQGILKLVFEAPSGDQFEIYAKIMWSEKTRCGVRFIMSDQAVLKSIKEIAGVPKDPEVN